MAVAQFDQFDAAAAQIAHQPIGARRSGQNAKTAQPGFLFTGQNLNFLPAKLAGPAHKFRPVLGIPRGGRCQHVDADNPHIGRQSHETGQSGQRLVDTIVVQAAGRVQPRPSPHRSFSLKMAIGARSEVS